MFVFCNNLRLEQNSTFPDVMYLRILNLYYWFTLLAIMFTLNSKIKQGVYLFVFNVFFSLFEKKVVFVISTDKELLFENLNSI
jgi:hypothetical protein